jgi:hypothetical protein
VHFHYFLPAANCAVVIRPDVVRQNAELGVMSRLLSQIVKSTSSQLHAVGNRAKKRNKPDVLHIWFCLFWNFEGRAIAFDALCRRMHVCTLLLIQSFNNVAVNAAEAN